MTDTEAMDAIAAILSGTEWSADTLDEIADVVRSTDREVKDLYDIDVDEVLNG